MRWAIGSIFIPHCHCHISERTLTQNYVVLSYERPAGWLRIRGHLGIHLRRNFLLGSHLLLGSHFLLGSANTFHKPGCQIITALVKNHWLNFRIPRQTFGRNWPYLDFFKCFRHKKQFGWVFSPEKELWQDDIIFARFGLQKQGVFNRDLLLQLGLCIFLVWIPPKANDDGGSVNFTWTLLVSFDNVEVGAICMFAQGKLFVEFVPICLFN